MRAGEKGAQRQDLVYALCQLEGSAMQAGAMRLGRAAISTGLSSVAAVSVYP